MTIPPFALPQGATVIAAGYEDLRDPVVWSSWSAISADSGVM